MPVPYKVVEKKDPRHPGSEGKYYAMPLTRGTIKLRELANEISQQSTLSAIDVMAMIEAMLQIIPDKLADGYNVSLGDFGFFRIVLNSDPAKTPDKFNATHISKRKMVFRPGKYVNEKLAEMEFQKVKE